MKYFSILLLFAAFNSIDGLGNITDIFLSIKDFNEDLLKYVPNFIPSPEDIIQSGKQLIGGYPFVFLFSVFNQLCAAALAENVVHPLITPDVNRLTFELITACDSQSYPILKSEELWNSPEFKRDKKVVIYSTGWMSGTNSSGLTIMSKAFTCRDDVNFVAVQVDGAIDTLYTWSALNTAEIGRNIAIALRRLDVVMPIENVHLIGHSLGAQIMGEAGRHFNELTGKKITHITGLDPAKPCFKESQALPGIDPDVAEFVDIIHTNPGVAGIYSSVGDADFYLGGRKPIQKGCLTAICSHLRAYEYYAESVYPGNENNFPSVRCTSSSSLKKGNCKGDSIPMGYAVPSTARGDYVTDVNKSEPYGSNAPENATLSTSECGLCE